ncbi:MAG: TrkA family potassium uptake protein [Verrucomicrobiales bacterium]|nr:TrkA family potassium uptake protein [Verrucomicrobiales bacterium]
MARRFFILGAGRFGVQLATRLNELGCEVVLCDNDARLVQDLSEQGFRSALLDVDDAGDLKAVGIETEDPVVVAIGENMQASVLATITLKELGVAQVIARATSDKHGEILRRLGADRVIAPDREAAHRLAEELHANTEEQRLPFHGEYQLARIRLSGKLAGRTMGEVRWEEDHRVAPVLVVRRQPGKSQADEFLPAPKETLMPGDLLFVVGHKDEINAFEERFGYRTD